MTADQEKELLESLKQIAASFDYLNRAVKALAAKQGVNLSDVPSSKPRS